MDWDSVWIYINMDLDNTFTAQSDLLMGVVDVSLLSSCWHLLRLHVPHAEESPGKSILN